MSNNQLDTPPLDNARLRRPQVIAATGLARSTIDLFEMQGRFPRRKRIGLRICGWKRSDVELWLEIGPDEWQAREIARRLRGEA